MNQNTRVSCLPSFSSILEILTIRIRGAAPEDPATEVAFPTELELPGTPKLSLLGLGVRTVSFLGIRVYSVGFYADLRQPMFEVGL